MGQQRVPMKCFLEFFFIKKLKYQVNKFFLQKNHLHMRFKGLQKVNTKKRIANVSPFVAKFGSKN